MQLAHRPKTIGASRGLRRRFFPKRLSLGAYLGLSTGVVLLGVALVLIVDLVRSQREASFVAREQSARNVAGLFAGAAWAELVFRDTDGLDKDLANLRHDDSVESAAVFVGAERIRWMSRSGVEPVIEARDVGIARDDAHLYATESILTPDGTVAGTATITFSLEAENRVAHKAMVSLAIRASIIALTTMALLMVLARRTVIRPLTRLVRVAQRIERGDLRVDDVEPGGHTEMAALANAFSSMSIAIADREERLQSELKVAAGLQMSILPRDPAVPGLEIAAYMEPTTEVGGDYYDVIPTADGCWIGVGDVSGHGLGAGVVMLMLQSCIASLVRAQPDASPARVACLVNEVLFDNIRNRMKRRDHATLSILRLTHDGVVRLAGAHEDILVWRAASRTVERVETPGTWVGAVRSIEPATEETRFELAPGDTMVLYTDGITEARRAGEQLGLERIEALMNEHAGSAPVTLKDAIVSAVHSWSDQLQDDISVVVVRRSAQQGTS
ncbi:MAG: uncharacterized protein JWP97_4907 [Labilithrix sp.]|nr:uncharacterized protein [Labilithrix sp.]